MKEIYQLVQSLTYTEWHSVRKYLTCFATNEKLPQEKILKLAQILKSTKDGFAANSYYSKKLYGTVNEEAINRLARNLKYKIFDCLVLTSHSHNAERIPDRETAVTKLKKKCLQYHYLSQNKRDLAVTRNLLNEIISMAKAYEAYPELVQHLKLKNWAYNLREGTKQFDSLSEEIEKYDTINQVYAASYNYVAKLYMLNEFSAKPDNAKIEAFLQVAILDVKRKYAATKSKIVLYYCLLLEISFRMLKDDYSGARRLCHQIIKLIKTNKSVFTKRRVGTAYDNLSTCSMHLGRFEEAVEYTRYALQFIQEGSYNYALSKQLEFYALFYNSQFNEAIECAVSMINVVRKQDLGSFRYEKFNFLLACAYFKQRMFIEAHKVLKNKFEIKKDKDGWEFNWRMLRIMTEIELGKEENAEIQTEQLRKFIHNNLLTASFSPRQRTIEKFLTLSMRKGFMFSKLNDKSENCLNLLSSATNEFKWKRLSSELIPFHEWIGAKLKSARNRKKLAYA